MAVKTHSFTNRQHMVSRTFEIYRYRNTYLNEVALHHHDFYEIYFFLSGNVNYTIENRNYKLHPGDILLISPNELHQPTFGQEQHPYERFVVWISKNYLSQLVSLGCDLTRCFDTSLPSHTNLLHPGSADQNELIHLLERILAEQVSEEFGSNLFTELSMIQLLLQINRLSVHSTQTAEIPDKSSSVVSSVLEYINNHYAEELSLDVLANKFFISKYHLSREFNRLVGISVHRYITQKRLAVAKQLLSRGIPASQVHQYCGFGDHSNFYRAFRAEYQMSPREYTDSLKTDENIPAFPFSPT